jgi:hypothetical protein
MRHLRAQGYSGSQIAKMLGMDEDFIQEVLDEGWGKFDFGALIGKTVLVKEKLTEPGTGHLVIGTATVIVKEISASKDRVLLECPKPTSISHWSETRNLKIMRELEGESDLPARGVDTDTAEGTDISPELKSFCIDYITALGEALDEAIRIGRREYEAGFNEAMHKLSNGWWLDVPGRDPYQFGVPSKDRPRMLAEIKHYAEVGGIPYNKLSPLNQFIVTIPPYVFYCLEKYLSDEPQLEEEARRLISTGGFPRYLQEELGYPISQRIKGAFRIPKPLGFLSRKLGFGRRH